MRIGISSFASRQFFTKNSSEEMEKVRNGDFDFIPLTAQRFQKQLQSRLARGDGQLRKGYAPFCMGLYIKNWTKSLDCWREINTNNQHLGRFSYIARKSTELPVGEFYLEDDGTINPKIASHLHIILYDYKQLMKEDSEFIWDGFTEWYIICIKAQNVGYETPMTPITMMRNALGIEEGGSGVPLNKDEYTKSVIYHQKNARVKLLSKIAL